MAQGPTRRQALYFPSEMLGELQREAQRQDRSISWLIHQAWKIAREDMKRIPSTTDFSPRTAPVVVSDASAETDQKAKAS